MIVKAFGIVCAAALLASCDTGTGTTPQAGGASPAAKKTIYTVGQVMKNDANQSVTVTSYQRGASSGNEFLQPAAGNECVRVKLALVNGDKSAWTLPLSEISVVDATGQSHDASFTCGDNTSVDGLVPNGTANGTLNFETPKGAALLLTWTPSVLNPNSTYQTSLP